MLNVGNKVVYPYQGPCLIGAVVKKVCSKKENLVERTYDELKFVDVFKKHFSEAKNSVGSAARLRLVVCKGHRRGLIKIISSRRSSKNKRDFCSRVTMPFSYVVSAAAELFFGIAAHTHSMAGLRKRPWESPFTIFSRRSSRSRPATLKRSFGGTVAGLESWSKLQKKEKKLSLRVTGRCARVRTEVLWRF